MGLFGKIGNFVSSAVSTATNGVHHIVDLGLHEGSSIAKAIGHAAVDVGSTVSHDASSAFKTVTHGASDFGGELLKTAGGIGHAIGDGASAIGNGLIQAV